MSPASGCSSVQTSTSRSPTARSPTTRGSAPPCQRSVGSSTMVRRRSSCARTWGARRRPRTESGYSIAPVAARLRSLLPDPRIRVLENTRFHSGETRDARNSRASSPTAWISTSTMHSARPIGRTARRRGWLILCRPTLDCCCSRSSIISAACSARWGIPSCSSPAAPKSTTSSRCSRISADAPTRS